MDCKEFHYWLNTRDIHECTIPDNAVTHMASCHECEKLFRKDSILEQELGNALVMKEIPRGLVEKIDLTLDHDGRQSIWPYKKTGTAIALTCLVSCLVFLAVVLIAPNDSSSFKTLNHVSSQAVTNHLKGNRYMSFKSTEVEQALGMLTKELGFKVILPDLKKQGCMLIGGRLCALGECRAAYFVVERNGKAGSLFIMDTDHIDFQMADGSRFTTNIKGCETCVWKDNGQVYAMVF